MLISWVISTDFSDVWEHGMWLRNRQIRFFMTADDCATWKNQWKALSRKTCFLYGTNELNAPFLGYLRHIRFQGMPNKHIQKTPFWTPYRHIDETNYVWNRLLIYIQCFCAKNLMANDSVECSAGSIADTRQGSIQYLDGIKFAGWWGRYDKFIENVWRKRSCQTALKMRVLACLTKFMMFHVHWISLKWGHWSSFYIAQREKTFINSTRIVKNSKQKFDAHVHWKTIFFVENALWVPFHRHFAV